MGYAGPGENTGNTTFSIGYGGDLPKEYGGSLDKMNKADWWKGSDAWEKWFRNNAPGVERHKYLYPDEPDFKGPDNAKGPDQWIQSGCRQHGLIPIRVPGKSIPILVTNKIRPDLKDMLISGPYLPRNGLWISLQRR